MDPKLLLLLGAAVILAVALIYLAFFQGGPAVPGPTPSPDQCTSGILTQTCADGSIITTHSCVNSAWIATGQTCPSGPAPTATAPPYPEPCNIGQPCTTVQGKSGYYGLHDNQCVCAEAYQPPPTCNAGASCTTPLGQPGKYQLSNGQCTCVGAWVGCANEGEACGPFANDRSCCAYDEVTRKKLKCDWNVGWPIHKCFVDAAAPVPTASPSACSIGGSCTTAQGKAGYYGLHDGVCVCVEAYVPSPSPQQAGCRFNNPPCPSGKYCDYWAGTGGVCKSYDEPSTPMNCYAEFHPCDPTSIFDKIPCCYGSLSGYLHCEANPFIVGLGGPQCRR